MFEFLVSIIHARSRVVLVHTLVFDKPFCNEQKLIDYTHIHT
jgi:hypothetical protein